MTRIYDIKLSCGCLISTDDGGGLIPCHDDENCKYEEEYLNNPKYKERQQEILRKNGYTEGEIEKECGKDYIDVRTHPDYKRAFNILMEYFEYLTDEEKERIDEKLKECGV